MMINCYIPPGSKEENKKLLQSVKSVIRRAKQKYPQNPLIVAGDFNYYY
jgi:exonuclease III